jgi:hypothetical protein
VCIRKAGFLSSAWKSFVVLGTQIDLRIGRNYCFCGIRMGEFPNCLQGVGLLKYFVCLLSFHTFQLSISLIPNFDTAFSHSSRIFCIKLPNFIQTKREQYVSFLIGTVAESV